MIEPSPEQDRQIALALDCWYVTGATASGKTEVSLALAELLDAEIISLDSMAVYRGMDVGTAKPRPRQRNRIPHHLIDICDPVESFSVHEYRDAAIRSIKQIRARGKEVVFVGGTALYLKALLRGLFDGPAADWEFRHDVQRELELVPAGQLHERLKQVDPLAAHKLHPNDKRRIIRALEVYRQTGHPISHLQGEFDSSHSAEGCRVFALRHPRPKLHERIEVRVRNMFENDFVGEVRRLLERWGALSRTATQAVGYREVISHLHQEFDLAECRQRVLFRTRQFARHQETWFRGLRECRVVDIDLETDASSIARQIFSAGQVLRRE